MASDSSTTRPQWVRDLENPPVPKQRIAGLADPPAFAGGKRPASSKATAAVSKRPTGDEMETLKLKKAWEVAFGPAKALPMNAIMMYMSGNSLQIFSIMMVFMLFKTPITSLMQTNTMLNRFQTERNRGHFWVVKATYVLMNLVALALGVWKVNGMGLLPTTRSDWLAWEKPRVALENTIFAF